MDQTPNPFADAVRSASRRPEIIAAISELYQNLQNAIDKRRPLCVASGKCCQFERYGHRLYITTAEMAASYAALRNHSHPPENPTWNHSGCPFQIGRLCGIHSIRPFGCRIFFCDPTSTDWQQQEYENFHARIKQLHQTHQIPYFYMEWRQALGSLGLLPAIEEPHPI